MKNISFRFLLIITFLHFSTVSLAHFHNLNDTQADIESCKICKLTLKIFFENDFNILFEKSIVLKEYNFIQTLNLKISFLNHTNIRAPPKIS